MNYYYIFAPITVKLDEPPEITADFGNLSISESVVAQARSVTPKFTQQVISPEDGYTHLSQVTVYPITVSYSDNSAGGKTVTIGAA